LGIEALIPHQRANTPDPSIEKMIYYRIESDNATRDVEGSKDNPIQIPRTTN
jgi:hypothetical protein